jgi:hypothetical protein
MTTEKKSAGEQFQAYLQQQAAQLCDNLGIKDAKALQMVHETLKAASKESWKNGLQAGRRRATAPKSA